MFDPRKWFTSQHRKPEEPHAETGPAPHEQVQQMLDMYDSRATVDAGESVFINPGQVLENVHHLMERLDLDPTVGFAPDEAIRDEELEPLAQMQMWELVIVETAWSARRILAPRWPQERVEGQIADAARLSMFIDGPGFTLTDETEARGKTILNRALANTEQVADHPELAGLAQADLVNTWVALLAWYGVKCLGLHSADG